MRSRTLALAAVSVAAAVTAAGCGGGERPMRIGVLTDCQGPFRGFEEAELSGAVLPLLEHGARLRGTAPTDGVTPATVAGRKVKLVRGCAETGEYTVFVEEARRLVESEHVDAIVGGDGTVIRDVARLYPDVPFLATFWAEQEVTLRSPASNLYRFTIDYGQQVAGLGSYAYHDLGWRRATTVTADSTQGWGASAAFAAEFCALGGKIVDQVYSSPFVQQANVDARAVRGRPDGVALLLSSYDTPTELVRNVVRRLGRPSQQLLLAAPLIEDASFRKALGGRLDGVVATSFLPATEPTATLADHRRDYAESFPGLPRPLGDASFVLGFRDSVQAVLTAVADVGGDLSDGRRRLRERLASLDLVLPRGRVHLDHNRQAVVDVPLVRLRWQGGKPGTEPVRVSRGVEQSFGGLLSKAPPPGPRSQPCVKATPPPWAVREGDATPVGGA